MIGAIAEDRNRKAAEYLVLLRSLAAELERAMKAISRNALSELEESVSNQQTLSAQLSVLAEEISGPLKENPAAPRSGIDPDLMGQILTSNEVLQKLNRAYAALLQHSSRSVALMVSLFDSMRGQFQEVSGPRLKHQTWSCQM